MLDGMISDQRAELTALLNARSALLRNPRPELSKDAKERIAAAQRKRWALYHRQQKKAKSKE
jgi:hypothetical protein